MPNDERPPLVFHYSREERLKRATPAVRDLNDPNSRPKPGLFRALTANRGLSFLFIAIVLLSLTAMMTTFLNAFFDYADLSGNRISAECFRFGDAVYITINKEARRDDAYRGPVGLAFSSADENGAVDGLLFSAAETEEFRRVIPTEATRVELDFLAGTATAKLELAVK